MGNILCNQSERTLEGIVLPWDEPGPTNVGNAVFPKDTIDWPHDLSRVKLLSGHSPEGKPVGHAIAAESKEDGLWMKFQLGSGDDATKAIVQAQEKVIDSFSIEGVGLKQVGNKATECLLKAVALVPFPAFSSAQVKKVNAEQSEKKDDMDKKEESTKVEKKEPRPAVKPVTGSGSNIEVKASFEKATDLIMGVRSGAISLEELHAELQDVTLAESIKTAPPAWLGELWEGVQYERQVINLVSRNPLTSRKASGYRWVTKPAVAKWDGESEIHSVKPTWVEEEVTAQPWAGGNNIPRPVLDFGEVDKLRDYWAAIAESYAEQTDADFAKFLVGKATEATGGKAPDMLRAVTRGALQVRKAAKRDASFVIINPDDLELLLEFSQLEIPHYANLTKVSDPSKWTHSEHVPSGTLLVGHTKCATFFELPGSPLRAHAEQIATGSRDVGLFGYTAQMMNHTEGLLKVQFNKTAPNAGR